MTLNSHSKSTTIIFIDQVDRGNKFSGQIFMLSFRFLSFFFFFFGKKYKKCFNLLFFKAQKWDKTQQHGKKATRTKTSKKQRRKQQIPKLQISKNFFYK